MILYVLSNYSAVLYYNFEYFAYCDSVCACRVFMTSDWPAIVQYVVAPPHPTPSVHILRCTRHTYCVLYSVSPRIVVAFVVDVYFLINFSWMCFVDYRCSFTCVVMWFYRSYCTYAHVHTSAVLWLTYYYDSIL